MAIDSDLHRDVLCLHGRGNRRRRLGHDFLCETRRGRVPRCVSHFVLFPHADNRTTLVWFTGRSVGLARAVRLSDGLGAAALLLTFFPSLALIGFGLAGLAFSVGFPTTLAWAAREHPDLRAQMASISIASAGLSSLFVPSIIGVAVATIGVWTLTPILIVTALAVVGLTYLEQRRVTAGR